MNRDRPRLVLCTGSLGRRPWEVKVAAAASAGFDGISVYGSDILDAASRDIDAAAVVRDHALFLAEVDGVVTTTQSADPHDEALRIAAMLDARSITMVESGAYDPADPDSVDRAVTFFGELCDRAEDLGALVHIEPFAWSPLARLADAVAIIERADRPNGGLLLDLHHHVSGPDAGSAETTVPAHRLFGIQLADTRADPLPDRRDECMGHRQLPGTGTAELADRIAALAAQGPLPPIGVEVFGEALDPLPADDAADAAMNATTSVLQAAGVGPT